MEIKSSEAPIDLQEFGSRAGYREAYIAKTSGKEVLTFVERRFDLSAVTTLVLKTTQNCNLVNQPAGFYNQILNLHQINDIRYINTFLETINSCLPSGGTMLICGETKSQRKQRIMREYPYWLSFSGYLLDYLNRHLLQKLPAGKGINFKQSKGHRQVLSRAEILGRVVGCGFEILEEKEIDGKLYVTARKIRNPAYNLQTSQGPLIFLNRIGKGGKLIKVYKMRTMHPHSEYLQEYIYRNNNLEQGGKLRNDFRITTPGRILRRLWLDEFPMLWNLLKGDLKLVGVRPLSKHNMSLYTPEFQQKRIKFKPGLVPPCPLDLPLTIEEIEESEKRYLCEFEKAPLRTDLHYFMLAIKNIIFK